MHRQNGIYAVHIGPAKCETLLKTSTHGIQKNPRNTVGRFFLIACLDAVKDAFKGFRESLTRLLDKRIVESAPGHAHWAVNNGSASGDG